MARRLYLYAVALTGMVVLALTCPPLVAVVGMGVIVLATHHAS